MVETDRLMTDDWQAGVEDLKVGRLEAGWSPLARYTTAVLLSAVCSGLHVGGGPRLICMGPRL